MNAEFRSGCPISSSLEIFGDKWSLLILRDLIFYEKKGFKGFSQSKEGIATNILSDRLCKLLDHGIIVKEHSLENRRVSLYSITPKGIDLIEILLDLVLCGA